MKLIVLCILLLTAGIAISSDLNVRASVCDGNSAPDANTIPKDSNGPTVLLGYTKEDFKRNPISSFMYFVPLISPTLVEVYTSTQNQQQIGIISYEKKITSKSFNLVCEFELLGKGFHKNTFDPAGVIAMYIGELKEGETLTNLLDYIEFQGQGFGRIEVKGTMSGSVPTVSELDLRFNARDHKSPVIVGLYDIKPKNGQYKYENRSNEIVARVNTLSFKKTEGIPHMGIKVASISDAPDTNGIISKLKGVIANLLLRPPPVTKLGNQTMLDFGSALLQQKPAFTFPKAENIKKSRPTILLPGRPHT
jgi:hypothetical protein